MTARRTRPLVAVGVALWLVWPLLSRAQQTRDTTVAARGSATLSGTVVADDGGTPIARALVTVRGVVPAFSAVASTDADGHFTVTDLPAEDITVTASKAAYLSGFYGARDRVRGPAVPFALAPGAPAAITIRLARAGVITGVVTGLTSRPQPGVQVSARFSRLAAGGRQIERASQGEGGLTDDRGRYRIWNLSPGEYVVETTPPTGALLATMTSDAEIAWATALATGARPGTPPSVGRLLQLAPVYYPGTIDGTQSGTVVVGAGQVRDGIDLALQAVPTVDLSGTLVGLDGQAVPRHQVVLDTALGDLTATSDAAGHFVFHGVPPGPATLSARMASSGAGPAGPGTNEDAWALESIALGGDAQVTLALRPGMTASGRVAFEGTPPSGQSRAIIALTVDGPGARPAQAIVADDGSFTIPNLAPGHYLLHPALPGVPPAGSAPWVAKSVLWQGQDLLDSALDVEPDQDIQGLTVVFSNRLADLGGTFLDSTGHPIAGYEIVLFATDPRFWTPEARRTRSVLVGRDGHFDFQNLPAGEYRLAAVTHVDADDLSDPDWLNAVAPLGLHVTVADGEHKRQDIRLGK